jgi:sodium pump decarboxylase gamma subunit
LQFLASCREEEWILNIDTILQGLAITLVGMGLVFVALGLIVLAMELMGHLLRPRTKVSEETSAPDADVQERARVAAMAAAIVMAQHRSERRPGDAWRSTGRADTPSPWQASHRAQALTHRSDR